MYWKAAIEDHQDGAEIWYTDGSNGREEDRDRIATVWDGEVRGLRGA